MTESILSAPYFHNEEAAYAFVEVRIWPNGPVCPKCGSIGKHYLLKGKSTRIGVRKCRDCRKPFRVTVNTVFESSHIPLRVWLQAVFLIASSKKGISSNQLSRSLGITLNSAWFMSHRIREAMHEGNLAPFGANGGAVEADETYIGNDLAFPWNPDMRRYGNRQKYKVRALVDRDTKQARSFVVDDMKAASVHPIVRENLAREARLMTDESPLYKRLGREFAAHSVVNHRRKEYVNPVNPDIHSNTVEGLFSVFKRGMRGTYQHCAHNHLHRYLAEFDCPYNNRKATGVEDTERAEKILRGVYGKRLTYETATV
jgi:transposase-like protein